VIVRLSGDRLVEVARRPGLTNHVAGEAVIRGGLRDCGSGPELVLATPDWSAALVVRLKDRNLMSAAALPIESPAGLDRALACP
jgi:hypothetical protein